jgi:hypothetical protein
MNSSGLFVYSVVHGLIGKDVTSADLGMIEVKGDRASGVLSAGGKTLPTRMELKREAGAWRIDLVSLFPPVNAALKKAREESGLSENDFILKFAETISGKPVPGTIWNPPR